ncbi:MAG: DUF4956 domain-containing protein [Bacteroidota bacterium]
MFESQPILDLSLSFQEVAVRFLVALICGLIISFFYRASYRGTSYSASYVISLIALAMITASVIMVIGNNLARAFGLVGAMSIIRFRTAVKDTTDIVFIFFSLAMGMAAGVGLHVVAITGTAFIGLVIWVLTIANYGTPTKREYLLQFNYTPGGDSYPAYQPILERFCKSHKMINVKAVGDLQDLLELSFYVHLHHQDDGERLMQELTNLQGVQYANLFFDEHHV